MANFNLVISVFNKFFQIFKGLVFVAALVSGTQPAFNLVFLEDSKPKKVFHQMLINNFRSNITYNRVIRTFDVKSGILL